MSERIALDSLVDGFIGSTNHRETMRVYRVSPHGWVAGINDENKQRVMYPGRFEVVDKPRPVKARTNIPRHLQ